jgi:hypothetical protein
MQVTIKQITINTYSWSSPRSYALADANNECGVGRVTWSRSRSPRVRIPQISPQRTTSDVFSRVSDLGVPPACPGQERSYISPGLSPRTLSFSDRRSLTSAATLSTYALSRLTDRPIGLPPRVLLLCSSLLGKIVGHGTVSA